MNAVAYSVPELPAFNFKKKKLDKAVKTKLFLLLAASIPENHSGSLYITFSICTRAYCSSIPGCEKLLEDHNEALLFVAEEIHEKRQQ